jgi:Zn-dependent protease
VLLVGMTVHEFAHAYVAYLMGDNTAKSQGRMTLDPRANIYVPGFLMGIFLGVGILGFAPVNPSRMRDPRWGYFWAVLAGPISNLLVAVVFAVPFLFGVGVPNLVPEGNPLMPGLREVLISMVFINVAMFIFNLLPIHPLDGWTVAYALLPPRAAIWWERNKQTTLIIGVALIVLSFLNIAFLDPLGWIFRLTVNPITSFLLSPLF